MRIFQATPGDIPRVTPLFVEYRAFYRLPARPEAAEAFLLERCTAGESVLFVAQSEAGEVLGFAHLYPLFCSLALKPIWLPRLGKKSKTTCCAMPRPQAFHATHPGAT